MRAPALLPERYNKEAGNPVNPPDELPKSKKAIFALEATPSYKPPISS